MCAPVSGNGVVLWLNVAAIKIQIGSAYPLDKPLTMEIKGRNLIEGVPKTITIDDTEIREALSESVATIMNAIRVALERTPPELSADISDRGIVLTGGGAMLKNLERASLIPPLSQNVPSSC